MKKSRANFSDVDCQEASGGFQSSWKGTQASSSTECQTGPELYSFSDMDVQWGRYTAIEQFSVDFEQGDASVNLIDYLRKVNRARSRDELRGLIESGFVTIDENVCRNPRQVLGDKDFVELTVCRKEVASQTEVAVPSVELQGQGQDKGEGKGGEGQSSSRGGGGKEGDEDEDEDDYGYDDDFHEGGDEKMAGESKGGSGYGENKLASFLSRVSPLVEMELRANTQSKAFDGFDTMGGPRGSEEVSAWKTLSVDLERRRVTFPGWSDSRHYAGRVVRCSTTRNKERIYDVIFDDDGSTLGEVREEHIRVVDTAGVAHQQDYWSGQRTRVGALRSGIRVHVKAKVKVRGKRQERFVPARVTKVNKGGLYDVELDGGEGDKPAVPPEDLLVGLEEGMAIEARRPTRQELHCTGVSWNATGNSIAAAFGRTDVRGWCDLPGAVCVWSVFTSGFTADNPDLVLDHPSCLTCVRCHPEKPAIIAAGSFNGEVIVWDVGSASPEEPIGLSPIVEFCHKEPVMDVQWAYDSVRQEWTLVSVGADGKVLNWDPSNKLRFPIKGSLLSKPGVAGKSSRKEYPLAYGATSVSLSGGTWDVPGSSLSRRPKWILVGQEGGVLVRTQAKRALVLHGRALDRDDFKTAVRTGADLYTSLKGAEAGEGFKHAPHIGPVTSIDGSPFHRSLFLTAGQDGSVRIYHVLEAVPLLQWEPTPPPDMAPSSSSDAQGSSFGAITAARFSPIRPCVFVACSSDGFVYLFDLSQSTSGPVSILQADSGADTGARGSGSRGSGREGVPARPAFTDVCFNARQRDLLAASDKFGRVHTWRLGWSLSNRQMDDQRVLDGVGMLASTEEAADKA